MMSERPDLVPHRRHALPVEDRLAARRRARRSPGRSSRATASTAGKHRRPGSRRRRRPEQRPLRDPAELRPLLAGRSAAGPTSSSRFRGTRRDATASTTQCSREVRVGHREVEEEDADREQEHRPQEPVGDGEDAPVPRGASPGESGAMNVYSIVPSQRSHATVSIRNSKSTPRYAQTTAPMSRLVATRVHVERRRRLPRCPSR